MKRALIFIALVCFTSHVLASEEQTVSPKKAFTIFNRRTSDESWESVLHFNNEKHKDIRFNYGPLWPALFYISPDEQWILQDQKTGSGDGIGILYRLEPNGRLWHMSQNIEQLAFDFHDPNSWSERSQIQRFVSHRSRIHFLGFKVGPVAFLHSWFVSKAKRQRNRQGTHLQTARELHHCTVVFVEKRAADSCPCSGSRLTLPPAWSM